MGDLKEWDASQWLRSISVSLSLMQLVQMSPKARAGIADAIRLEPPPNSKAALKKKVNQLVREEVGSVTGFARSSSEPATRKRSPLSDIDIPNQQSRRSRSILDVNNVSGVTRKQSRVQFAEPVEDDEETSSSPMLRMRGNFYTMATIQPKRSSPKEFDVKQVLIDGGSCLNLMPERMIGRLGMEIVKDDSIVIKCADGNYSTLPGFVYMKFTVATVETIMQVSVVKGNTSYNLLLGRPWLRKVKAIGMYEFDEYWIKDRFGNEHKLEAISPPAPVKTPRVLLSAKAQRKSIPFDKDTIEDLEATQDGDTDKLLDLIIKQAEESEDDHDYDASSEDDYEESSDDESFAPHRGSLPFVGDLVPTNGKDHPGENKYYFAGQGGATEAMLVRKYTAPRGTREPDSENDAVWPEDQRGRKQFRRVIREVHQAEIREERIRRPRPQWRFMAPKLRNEKNHHTVSSTVTNELGTHHVGVVRRQGTWEYSGCDTWHPNNDQWGRVPDVVAANKVDPQSPPHKVQISDSDALTTNRPLWKDSTVSEKRYQERKAAGLFTQAMLASELPACIPQEEVEFGSEKLGFPTLRRVAPHRRPLSTIINERATELVDRFPEMCGPCAETPEQKEAVMKLIATWDDLFVEDIRSMPTTDLVTHLIPTYQDAIPRMTRPRLYTAEEVEWQHQNLPKLEKAGVIARCYSPWAAPTLFPRKHDKTLRMVNAFNDINNWTIKANTPMKRMEPILQTFGQPWLQVFFQADAANGYYAIKTHAQHAYKTGISTAMGQYCYLRMGQGLTGSPGTYTHMKDIATGPIPEPDPEPALPRASPGVVFEHFVDDDLGGGKTFQDLFNFMHHHYFPRLAWAKLTLNPKKCRFFIAGLSLLGLERTAAGLRPSADKIAAIRDYPEPTNEKELARFLHMLPYLKAHIPGRSDHCRIMNEAVLEEVEVYLINGRKRKRKQTVGFSWGSRQRRSFEAVKEAIISNAIAGGDINTQYHLATDASGTGIGAVLFQLPGISPGTIMSPSLLEKVKYVMFMSFQLLSPETRYHTTEREALAVLRALEECRWLVLGSTHPTKIYTDHQALLKVLRAETANARLARWQLRLGEYPMEIHHVPGKDLAIADGLSRITGPAVYTPPDISKFALPALAAESNVTTRSETSRNEGIKPTIQPTDSSEQPSSDASNTPAKSSRKSRTEEEMLPALHDDWEHKWAKWLEDPWYEGIVVCKKDGRFMDGSFLEHYQDKVTRLQAKYFIMVEDEKGCRLAYKERSGKLSRCIHPGEIQRAMVILHNVHGHFSSDITLQRSIGRFWWPTRRKDIVAFCRSCFQCQSLGPLKPTQGLLPVLHLQPLDCIGLDYIGPFSPISKSGARYILIAVDYFSGFLWARALPAATSANTVEFFHRAIVDVFGFPRMVYTDNGSHFKRFFTAMLAKFEVKHLWAPTSHPQSVGMSERYVQIVLAALRSILQHVGAYIFDWDKFLRTCVHAINTRLIKVHGFSPSQLLMGFEPTTTPFLMDFDNELRSQALQTRIEELQRGGATVPEAAYEARLASIDEIRTEALKAKLANKQSVAAKNFKDNPVPQKGDLVLLRRLAQDGQKSHKLEPRWEGPHRVTKLEWHSKTLWLEPLKGGRSKKYHVNDVKKFVERQPEPNAPDWKSFAKTNEEVRQKVNDWQKNRKKTLKAQGLSEKDMDVLPDKVSAGIWDYPDNEGQDEIDEAYWRHRAINLDDLVSTTIN